MGLVLELLAAVGELSASLCDAAALIRRDLKRGRLSAGSKAVIGILAAAVLFVGLAAYWSQS